MWQQHSATALRVLRAPAILFVALFLSDLALKHGRFTAFDLQALCSNVLPLAAVAVGQFFVVLTRGIDLSAGPVLGLAGSIAAVSFVPAGTLPALGFAVGGGIITGLLNAVLVVVVGLPPIVVTLGTMSIVDGAALLILPNPGGTIPSGLQLAVTGTMGLAPVSLLLLLVLVVVGLWLMGTRYGLHLRAVGGDEAAARTSGVRAGRIKFGAYVLAGLFAASGGIYMAIATSAGSPIIGDSFILPSIAAVVLGGVPLIGGEGSPLGVVLGALSLTLIGSLLYFADVSSFYQAMINGVILIAAVGATALRSKSLHLVRL
jgi:ribose transport system permease protein